MDFFSCILLPCHGRKLRNIEGKSTILPKLLGAKVRGSKTATLRGRNHEGPKEVAASHDNRES